MNISRDVTKLAMLVIYIYFRRLIARNWKIQRNHTDTDSEHFIFVS